MPQLQLTLQTVTPLLMYGAHNKDDRTNRSLRAQPELRASSMRGVLRYWLRAVLGVEYQASPSKVYDAESAIFGNTERGSRVRVRVVQSQGMQPVKNQTVLPRETRGHSLMHTAYPPDSRFRLYLTTHPLDSGNVLAPDSPLMKAVFLMTHLGGLGRRARRGSGNLRVLGVKGYEGELLLDVLPEDRDALAEYLEDVTYYASGGHTLRRSPQFPVFAQNTAVVLVGEKMYPHYEDAFDALWGVSGPYHREGGVFGDVRPRRASAIHMRVSETRAGYVAVQTILYSGSGNWAKMRGYINHCQRNGFQPVFGTWEDWE